MYDISENGNSHTFDKSFCKICSKIKMLFFVKIITFVIFSLFFFQISKVAYAPKPKKINDLDISAFDFYRNMYGNTF